jgi:hypothetical protein
MNQNTTERISNRMGRKRIPVPVILIACLYLAVGIGGFVAHFSDRHAPDWIWVEVTELLAIVCGVFLLRAHDWARWLVSAWMAFHVAMSFGELRQLAIHSLFLGLIVWCLFRADASRFFQKHACRLACEDFTVRLALSEI